MRALSKSAGNLRSLIEKAIEDHLITRAELDSIMALALEDGIIDTQEQALLDQLHDRAAGHLVGLVVAAVDSRLEVGQELRGQTGLLLDVSGEIEDLELDDLQGVNGLRALRATVSKTSPDVEFEVTPDGAMEPVAK